MGSGSKRYGCCIQNIGIGKKYDPCFNKTNSGSLLNMQVPQQSLIGTISNNSIVSDTIGSSINTGAVILDKSDMIISSGITILQPSTMVYVSLKVITVVVEYDIILYSLYTQQSFDLINYFMFLPRTTAIQAIINENIVIDIPVSMLITEVSESTFDFNLSGKGIKVYKVGGTLEALSYLLPMNVSGGQGEAAIINYWTVNNINSILYSPIKKIDLEFIVGGNIENQTIG